MIEKGWELGEVVPKMGSQFRVGLLSGGGMGQGEAGMEWKQRIDEEGNSQAELAMGKYSEKSMC